MGRAGSQLRSSKVPAEDSTAAAPVMMARYVGFATGHEQRNAAVAGTVCAHASGHDGC